VEADMTLLEKIKSWWRSHIKPVARPTVDYERAHKWIGQFHSNEAFCFVKCRTCGHFALMDDEIHTFYRNADDPGDARLYGIDGSVKCPNCGAYDSFGDTTEDDAEASARANGRNSCRTTHA